MKALFIIFSVISGFFLGALIGSAMVPKNAGLAGGATVFVYGIIGVIIGLTLALVFMNKNKPVLLKKITITFILLNIIYIVWIIYLIQATAPKEEPQRKPLPEKTEPVTAPATFFYLQDNEPD